MVCTGDFGDASAMISSGDEPAKGQLTLPKFYKDFLEHAPMRRRAPIALEVEIRSRGALRIGPRRWVREQRISLDGLSARQLSRPFGRLGDV
jgi:hypothetical protein